MWLGIPDRGPAQAEVPAWSVEGPGVYQGAACGSVSPEYRGRSGLGVKVALLPALLRLLTKACSLGLVLDPVCLCEVKFSLATS